MFDAHTHLHFAAFDADRAEVLARASEQGVRGLIIADYDAERRDVAAGIAGARPGIWYCSGLHPWAIAGLSDAEIDVEFEGAASHAASPSWVGIGEVGLDWVRATDAEERDRQRDVFRRFLALARDLEVPLVVHCVRAEETIMNILRSDGVSAAGGMLHGFSGSAEQARQLVVLGFDISVGTQVLRANTRKVIEVVRQTDRQALLIETDCPDQSPISKSRNEPINLGLVLAKVAQILDLTTDEVAGFTETNTRRRFGLGDAVIE